MLAPNDLRGIEQAAVCGWPALEVEAVDGWLARWSTGGSVRANSVAALAFTGADLDAALARVVAFYRARGGLPMFTVSEAAGPADLDTELERRGWRRGGDHVTMIKAVTPGVAASSAVALLQAPTAAWSAVYLQGLSEDRKAIALRLVGGVPRPRAFFAHLRQDQAIASGLSVIDGAYASVQCMATLPEHRRTGAATAVLQAIERHAGEAGSRLLYLQADAGNGAAIGAYERYGFMVASRYHTRTLDG